MFMRENRNSSQSFFRNPSSQVVTLLALNDYLLQIYFLTLPLLKSEEYVCKRARGGVENKSHQVEWVFGNYCLVYFPFRLNDFGALLLQPSRVLVSCMACPIARKTSQMCAVNDHFYSRFQANE